MRPKTYFKKYGKIYGISRNNFEIVHFKKFTDYEEAEKWLFAKEESEEYRERQLVSKWAIGQMADWYGIRKASNCEIEF